MGHAGAVISGGGDTADAKMQAMREAGITVCDGPHELGQAMKDALSRRRARVKGAGKRAPTLVEAPRKGGAPRSAAPAQRGGKAARKAAKGERD